ncbi:thiamine biosynthesis protein ThiF [Sulfurimonas sp. HSL-1716]|uniref:thiamine biosynthesis protein ThiF n=1 Tax=Hydrocurvibacter sulfurireducens TaxID=3131937 RepID=UPI0031F95184
MMTFKEIEQFDPISACEGVAGDGCGGGRIFFTDKDSLKVYDPTTKKVFTLLEDMQNPKELSKKGCLLFFTCEEKNMTYDLSKMSLI